MGEAARQREIGRTKTQSTPRFGVETQELTKQLAPLLKNVGTQLQLRPTPRHPGRSPRALPPATRAEGRGEARVRSRITAAPNPNPNFVPLSALSGSSPNRSSVPQCHCGSRPEHLPHERPNAALAPSNPNHNFVPLVLLVDRPPKDPQCLSASVVQTPTPTAPTSGSPHTPAHRTAYRRYHSA